MAFGSTQTGRDWCIKALHPSDPIMEVTGLPDMSAVPSTMLNYQSTVTVKCGVGATGTYSVELAMIPDATTFGHVRMTDSIGTTNTAVYNTQVAATLPEIVGFFVANTERHRLVYYGATVYVDAPALSNQGSIVAYQAPVVPLQVCVAHGAASAQLGIQFQEEDQPSYDRGIAMPNAFTGLAKEGCYMPLKLSHNHQRWVGRPELRCWCPHFAAHSWAVIDDAEGVPQYAEVPASLLPVAADGYPYRALPTYYSTDPATLGAYFGQRLFEPLNDNWGFVCIRDISVDASVRIVYRVGIEAQVQPGTPLAPYLKISPAYDKQALEEYYTISRELKDAYPSEYNDWDKLWTVIKTAANAIAPALSVFGPVGAAFGAGIPLAVKGIDSIAEAVKKKKKNQVQDKPPAASLERARLALAAPQPPLVSRPRGPKGGGAPLKIQVVRRKP